MKKASTTPAKPATAAKPTNGKPPASKSAEKPTGTALSAFADLRKDQGLRASMDKARKGAVSQDYDGDDGDLYCTFDKVGTGTTEGVQWRTVQFKVADVDGQKELVGKRASRFFKFEDGKFKTKAEVMGDFFQCFIDMGLDPENMTDEELLASLEEIAAAKTLFILRAKRNKHGYMNFYIQGPAEDVSVETADDQAEAEEEAEPEADEAGKPSDYDGYQVGYPVTTGKGPKKKTEVVTLWVTNCNDEAGTIDLVDEQGNTVVEGVDLQSDDITWPDP